MTHRDIDLPHGTAVAWSIDEVTPSPSVVTIGNFDGVHRGHRVLLRRAATAAAEIGLRSAVITFDPHPAAVLRPGSEPPALQTLQDRLLALADLGVDLVVVLPFTQQLAALTPREFVQQILVDRLEAAHVVVGTNFRFGHRAEGDIVTLGEEGERHGFVAEAVTILEVDDRPIASTELRSRIAAGDMKWATTALGRPYALPGEVVAGEGRGRTIGVPTANLAIPAGLLVPADGVYAGRTVVDGRTYPTVTNVGTRPTFDGVGRTIEAHLIDADIDLYGHRIHVSFESRLREERRFDDVAALASQIRRDVADALAVLDGGEPPQVRP